MRISVENGRCRSWCIISHDLYLRHPVIHRIIVLFDGIVRPCLFLLAAAAISLIVLGLVRVHLRLIAPHMLCKFALFLDRVRFFALSGRPGAFVRTSVQTFHLFNLVRWSL